MPKQLIGHELGAKPRTCDVLLPEDENLDFSNMCLPQNILLGLHKSGFVKPSPIQLKAIPLARCGFDLIVQAKSGTGKTCVFAVTALENSLQNEKNHLRSLILAPTREIAQQIQEVTSALGSSLSGLKVRTFIGGIPLAEDKRNIEKCQIAVGSPGRIRHLIEEGLMSVANIRLLVLDEADKLLEESFQEDISYIISSLPESKQVIACSATYTPDLMEFLSGYMQSATHVTPGKSPSLVLIGLRHFVYIKGNPKNNLSLLKMKDSCLLNILKNVPFTQCIIFSNYHSRAESICYKLKEHGWQASWIAGKLDQATRTSAIKEVKDLKVRVLVTTDLTARGIDIQDVNLVINMDVPADHHTYLHRMGRAGRFGCHGMVITLLSENEVYKFRRLLGAIGNVFASCYVIPSNGPSKNLWSADLSDFERIDGVLEAEATETDEDGEGENGTKINDDKTEEIGSELKELGSATQSSGYNTMDVLEVMENNHEILSLSSEFSGGKEEVSSSSVDVCTAPIETEVDEERITKFGLRLMQFKKETELVPYADLEESLKNFIEIKSDIVDMERRVFLEPAGLLDIETVDNFTVILRNNYETLMEKYQNGEAPDQLVQGVHDLYCADTKKEAMIHNGSSSSIEDSKEVKHEDEVCLDRTKLEVVQNKLDKLNLFKPDIRNEYKNLKDPELYSQSSSEDEYIVNETVRPQRKSRKKTNSISSCRLKTSCKDYSSSEVDDYVDRCSTSKSFTLKGKKSGNVITVIDKKESFKHNKRKDRVDDSLQSSTGSPSETVLKPVASAKTRKPIKKKSKKMVSPNQCNDTTNESAASCEMFVDTDDCNQQFRSAASNVVSVTYSNIPPGLERWYNMWTAQCNYINWYVNYNMYLRNMFHSSR